MDIESALADIARRVETLEESFARLLVAEGQPVTLQDCRVEKVTLGEHSTAHFTKCSAGTVVNGSFGEAQDSVEALTDLIADLEDRAEELEERLGQLEE